MVDRLFLFRSTHGSRKAQVEAMKTTTKNKRSEVSSNIERAEKLTKKVRESIKLAQKQKDWREDASFNNGDSLAQDTFQVEVYNMSPRLAREILDNCNLLNRKRDKRKVNQYCQDILNEDWKFEASSVMFDTQGYLIDGQHTLAAIAQASRNTEIILFTGCRKGVSQKIDCGRGRTTAQRFKFAGIFNKDNPNSKNMYMMRVIGSILRSEETPAGKDVKSGINERSINFYPDERIIHYLNEFSEGFEWIYENRSKHRGFSQAAVIAPIVMYYNQDEEKAKKFYNVLLAGDYTGNRTAAKNAVRTFRKHILDCYELIAQERQGELPNGFYGQGRCQLEYFFALTKRCIKAFDKGTSFKI